MTATFEVGATYRTSHFGDSKLFKDMKVIKRTEKMITVEYDGKTKRFKPYIYEDEERIRTGSYNFAPIFSASEKVM